MRAVPIRPGRSGDCDPHAEIYTKTGQPSAPAFRDVRGSCDGRRGDRRPHLARRGAAGRGARRRHHEPQLQGGCGRRAVRAPHRRARHRRARDRPLGGARGGARGRGGRRRAGGRGVRRARGLPRDPLHRGRRSCRSSEMREPAWIKRVAQALQADPSRAVAAGALQLVPGRRGLPDDGVLTRRRGAAELRLGAPGGAARRAGAGRVRRASLPQRSPQRELHRRRPAPADRRLGVRGDGRRLLRSRELLRSTTGSTATAARRCSRRTSARSERRTSGRSS